jgi:hypothetical protein
MNKYYLASLCMLSVFIYGCTSPEEDPLIFNLNNHPGVAVIGDGDVCVIYSDDNRVFETHNSLAGGIIRYYYKDNAISYIGGSVVEFIDEAGFAVNNRDTFGLDPFFSPFKLIETGPITARMQLFVASDGIVAQRISLRASRTINTFVHWSLSTPAVIESSPDITISRSDIMHDGIFHRYSNNTIIALASDTEDTQYNFDDSKDITSLVTPLRLEADMDTTLTFFIAAGETDMEVITKLFGAEEIDLFDDASRIWQSWLDDNVSINFPHEHYERSFYANLYALHAARLNGTIPVYFTARETDPGDDQAEGRITLLAEKAREYLESGDREQAEGLIHLMIENANSYGLMPDRLPGPENNTRYTPLSLRGCRAFITVFAEYFNGKKDILEVLRRFNDIYQDAYHEEPTNQELP